MLLLGVFKGMTRYTAAAGNLEGCSFMSVSNAGGVMCCKDDSTTPTIPPTNAPTAGSCNFERGLCSWIVDRTQPGTFSRRRGETLSRNTGPRYDHTKEDSTGKLVAPIFNYNSRQKSHPVSMLFEGRTPTPPPPPPPKKKNMVARLEE